MNYAELVAYFTVLGIFDPNVSAVWFTDCVVFVHEDYVRVISTNITKSTVMNYPISLEKLKEVIYEPS